MSDAHIHVYLGGMTSFSVTDLATARLDVISFFLVGYLFCALLLKLAWNYLSKDFTWMPKIGFGRSLALLVVSGLFLYVILTMISGARELMTPGAWKKTGVAYKLTSADREVSLKIRRDALANLGHRLQAHAAENGGEIPERRFDPALPVQSWIAGDGAGLPFEYIGGQVLDGSSEANESIVAYEPQSDDNERLALFGDGRIELLEWRTVMEFIATRKKSQTRRDE